MTKYLFFVAVFMFMCKYISLIKKNKYFAFKFNHDKKAIFYVSRLSNKQMTKKQEKKNLIGRGAIDPSINFLRFAPLLFTLVFISKSDIYRDIYILHSLLFSFFLFQIL